MEYLLQNVIVSNAIIILETVDKVSNLLDIK